MASNFQDSHQYRRLSASSYLSSVSPSAWNNSAFAGRIFMKFDIGGFFETFVEKIQVSLKSHKNNEYFTRKRLYTYDSISLNSP